MEKYKSENSNSLDDTGFDNLLRSAKVEVPLSGAFQSEVWRRIASKQEATWTFRLNCWLDGLGGILVRPAMASVAILAMATAGFWLGSQDSPPTPDGKLAYVASISPFAHEHQGGVVK